VLLPAGVNESLAGVPTVTVRLVLALVSPEAEATIVPLPSAVEVNAELAAPPTGVTGDGGEKEPTMPVAENETVLVAVVTVLL
jgi:hypothetical protein